MARRLAAKRQQVIEWQVARKCTAACPDVGRPDYLVEAALLKL